MAGLNSIWGDKDTDNMHRGKKTIGGRQREKVANCKPRR